MKPLKKEIKATVPGGSARLMKALVLAIFAAVVVTCWAQALWAGNAMMLSKGRLLSVEGNKVTIMGQMPLFPNQIAITKCEVNYETKFTGVSGVSQLAEHTGETVSYSASVIGGQQICGAITLADDEKDLIDAAKKGDISSVKALLTKDSDVDEGVTILEVMGALHKLSVVNNTDKDGRTALMWASKNGHTEIVQLLKKAGVKK